MQTALQKPVSFPIGKQNVSIVPNPTIQRTSFYKENDLYKYDNKNVIYLAYVGIVNGEDMYKYGKTSKLYDREYKAHRKNFETFEMQYVKITDNKDVVEDLLEKELQMRKIHRKATIKSMNQTELFTTTEEYTFQYIKTMLNRIVRDNPSHQVMLLKRKLDKLQSQYDSLQSEIESIKSLQSPLKRRKIILDD